MFYDDTYSYNDETNKSCVFCEVLESKISKNFKLDNWNNILNEFL